MQQSVVDCPAECVVSLVQMVVEEMFLKDHNMEASQVLRGSCVCLYASAKISTTNCALCAGCWFGRLVGWSDNGADCSSFSLLHSRSVHFRLVEFAHC